MIFLEYFQNYMHIRDGVAYSMDHALTLNENWKIENTEDFLKKKRLERAQKEGESSVPKPSSETEGIVVSIAKNFK